MTSSELDLTRYTNLINKHKRLFCITALSVMTIVVIVGYLLPKKYEAKSTVFIEKNVVAELLKGISVNPSMEDSQMAMTYVLTSRTLLVKVIRNVDFNLKNENDAEVEQLVDEIQKNITIKISGKGQNLFVISFQHPNPRIARDFVNTLVQMYIEENVSSNREESFGANKFLSEQISTYKERLDKAQTALNDFKSSKASLNNVDGDRLQKEIAAAQQRMSELTLRSRQLEEEKIYAQNATDPMYLKLTALTKRLDELRVQYTDNFPEVIETKAQIETLQKDIKGRKGGRVDVLMPQELWKIDAELKAIKETKKSLERIISENKAILSSIPDAKSTLDKLEAQRANEQSMYDLLFLRQNQSEVSKQMELQDKSTTFRIVDPAVTPIYPVSPNHKKIILIGIVAGFAIGFGALIALDVIDNSIKTLDMLKALGLPVLAVIPLIKSDEEIKAEKKDTFRVYLWSGCYFSLIIIVLILELLGVTLVDSMVSRLRLPAAAMKFLEKF